MLRNMAFLFAIAVLAAMLGHPGAATAQPPVFEEPVEILAGGLVTDPDFSPDGTRIVYADASDGNIYIVDDDGSNRSLLVAGTDPAWSPDGERIAFITGRNIQTITTDGANPVQVTDDSFNTLHPAWSPDGERIAFTRAINDDQGEIWIAQANGSLATRLTTVPEDGDATHPCFSPDGTQILYSRGDFSDLPGELAERPNRLDIMSDAGEDNRAFLDLGEGTIYLSQQCWSQRGEIVYHRQPSRVDDIDYEAAIVNSNGSGVRTILQGGPDELIFDPAWGPQSERVVLGVGTDAPLGDDIVGLNIMQEQVVNVFRFFDTSTSTHIWTTTADERQDLDDDPDVIGEGPVFRVLVDAGVDPQAVPVFRLFREATNSVFFTTSSAEAEFARTVGFTLQGASFAAYENEDDEAGLVPLFRLFNTNTEGHFFTASEAERDFAASLPGFVFEGVAFHVFPTN
jgi:hypothetical protein